MLVDEPPAGKQWLHEIKFDGYRIACILRGGKVRLESRRNVDWTQKFPEIVAAAKRLPVESALLDGEAAVVVASTGVTSFQSLQKSFLRGSSREGLTYFAFDLLYLDGRNLAALPLEQRKRACEALLKKQVAGSPIQYSQHFDVDGTALLERACAMGCEGIISKRRDQSYRAGRNDGWQKSKCSLRESFVIGGFTGGARSVGALLLGRFEDGVLRYVGKVGTGQGWNDEYLGRLRRDLETIRRVTCPFVPPPTGSIGRSGHWVEPVRTGDVVFTEWTAARTLRHPSFQGFHDEAKERKA